MRFYILPTDQGKTTCINFDHVAVVVIEGGNIELHFAGVETPMVIKKTPTTLAMIGKGMDISDSSKDMVSAL